MRNLVAVDPAHDGRQPPVEPADEEQASKGVVVDRGVEDEERDHDQGHDHGDAGAERGLYCLEDGGGRVGVFLRDDHHGAEGQEKIGGHDDDRAPDEVLRDRLSIFDLHAHVERNLDAEQGEDDQAVEGGVAAVQTECVAREVVGGRMAAEQPGESGQAHGQNRRAVDDEDAVDQVLGDPESQDRQP